MSFLYLLEKLRLAAPPVAAVFSVLTYLGDEIGFLLIALYVLWCVSKREGYYVLSVGFLGTIANQVLKIVCRVPRPWVRDPSFTIWEGAREAASGYSFPSGHTQNAAGTYGALGVWNRKRRFAPVLAVSLIVIVAFSRMILGVHTPADVLVSLGIGAVLVCGLYPLFARARSERFLPWFISAMLAIALGFVLFMELAPHRGVDPENYASAAKNAWTLLGAVGGVLLTVIVDGSFLRFETKAPPLGQLLKYVLGLIAVLIVKEGTKPLLALLLGDAAFTHAIRYFLTVAVAGCVWPLTFRFFARLGEKKNNAQSRTDK